MAPSLPAGEDLIERADALADVDAALDAASAGRGSVLVVEGEAGVGKTRVLHALRDRAGGRGLRVLGARGTELEQAFAFGTVAMLLGAALRGDPRLEAATPVAVRALLARGGGVAAPGDQSQQLLDGVFRVVELLGESPLVLVVDDAHWADGVSRRALAYVANRLDDLPVVLAIGRRTASADPAVEAVLGLPHTTRIGLAALTPAGTARLAHRQGAEDLSPADLAAVHTLTRGIPLLVGAIADDVVREGTGGLGAPRALTPSAVDGLVLSRLLTTSADAGAVAKAVAVLGDGAPVTQIAAMASLAPAAVLRAATELEDVGLFGAAEPLSFAHPLLAAAVREDDGANARALAHLRAAEVLREAGAPATQIAGHLVLGPGVGDPAAVADLRTAAALERSRAAPGTAVPFLERALAEPPDADRLAAVRTELGLAHHALGDVERAWEHLGASITDPAADVDVVVAACQARVLTAGIAAGIDAAVQAADVRAADSDDALRLRAVASYYDWWLPELERRRPELPAGPPGPDTTPGARLACVGGAIRLGLGPGTHHADRVALALAALGGGALARDSPMTLVYVNSPILLLLYAERLDEAERELREVQAVEHLEGWPGSRLTAAFPLIHLLLLRGEVAASVAEGRRLLELATTVSGPLRATLEGMTTGMVLSALLEHDGPAAADALLAEQGLDGALGPEWFLLLGHRSLVHLAAGRTDAALADAAAWRSAMAGVGDPVQPVELHAAEALALAAAGRTAEALDRADAELRRARDWGVPGRIAAQLRLRARLRPDVAETALTEALALVEPTPLRLERARVLLDLGRVQRRSGQRTVARETLQRAVQLGSECQAHLLAEAGLAELHVLGARPRRRAFSGVDALTASERRVADLAVEGRTTREIAEHLFVTKKTVESHLTTTYRKLGISSRTALRDALAGPDDAR
ncbi:helix-turn-helix transcriptional regulator [Patulibacter minatonensis]|uniref:helix-turn-helix transcriptional regulator n=1 Tax=Patulibacter minatonensis TaxID=298163 RepID=UPI00047CAF48|nr:LuxR family transcriptional regulator [Patulibacter minatonensis]